LGVTLLRILRSNARGPSRQRICSLSSVPCRGLSLPPFSLLAIEGCTQLRLIETLLAFRFAPPRLLKVIVSLAQHEQC
jgi:hypothetical protein